MKLLFSADWHIKLNTKNVPNEWAINRYRQLFTKLHDLEGSVGMHIIGGDIFDKLPSMQELELYFEFVADCKIKTLIIPGNHEATKKGHTFLTNLKKSTNLINPLVEIIDDYLSIDSIDFIPYNKLKDYHPANIDMHGDILITHVRGEIPPHVKPEVPLELFDRWKVVLAGDLHSYANSQRNVLYPGSPITTSFHRKMVDTGVIIIDTDTLAHVFHPLGLPQLLRKTIQVGSPMPPTSPDHTIYEIEGDMSELGLLADNALIDKKVVKRNIETALILTPEMSVEQEITEYLSYVLELSNDTIEKALQVYNDNLKNLKMG